MAPPYLSLLSKFWGKRNTVVQSGRETRWQRWRQIGDGGRGWVAAGSWKKRQQSQHFATIGAKSVQAIATQNTYNINCKCSIKLAHFHLCLAALGEIPTRGVHESDLTRPDGIVSTTDGSDRLCRTSLVQKSKNFLLSVRCRMHNINSDPIRPNYI